MTATAAPALPADTPVTGLRSAPVPACCRRAMSTITVTTRGVDLTLRSCTACGRHQWVRDGQAADRAALLAGVRTFLEQPRIPTPRTRRS